MDVHLSWEGTKFLPSKHGGLKNQPYEPDSKRLKEIKREAYTQTEIMRLGITNPLLRQIFRSGLCSGNTCVTMLKFAGAIAEDDDILMLQAIYQARVMRMQFLGNCLSNYYRYRDFDFDQIAEAMASDDYCQWPIITIMPKINNLKNIGYAHTIIPYRLKKQKGNHTFYVYDSNYPLQNHIPLPVYLKGKIWNYGKRTNQQWKLAITPLSSLLD